jgi:hypothetical protein
LVAKSGSCLLILLIIILPIKFADGLEEKHTHSLMAGQTNERRYMVVVVVGVIGWVKRRDS